MAERYALSKLLEVLACREIARNHSVDQLKVTLNFVRCNPLNHLLLERVVLTFQSGQPWMVHQRAGPL